MITGLNISIAILAILSTIIIADDPCKYTHPDKGTIDISSIGKSDGTPVYKDKIPTTGSNYKYSYNPCKAFSEGSVCKDVAACQVSMDGLFTFPIGLHNTAKWEVSSGLGSNPTIVYTAPEGKITRVVLECKRSGPEEFEALGEEPINTYKFRLAHKCSCWDECSSGPAPQTTTNKPGGGGGGSSVGGTVFIVILLVVIVVYFVGFAVFYRVREQKSGADLIAHRTFWVALPGYVKDGAVYTYRRVANKGADPYSSV